MNIRIDDGPGCEYYVVRKYSGKLAYSACCKEMLSVDFIEVVGFKQSPAPRFKMCPFCGQAFTIHLNKEGRMTG